MRLHGFQLVDTLQKVDKIDNLQRVCGVFRGVGYALYHDFNIVIFSFFLSSTLLTLLSNGSSLKSMPRFDFIKCFYFPSQEKLSKLLKMPKDLK